MLSLHNYECHFQMCFRTRANDFIRSIHLYIEKGHLIQYPTEANLVDSVDANSLLLEMHEK